MRRGKKEPTLVEVTTTVELPGRAGVRHLQASTRAFIPQPCWELMTVVWRKWMEQHSKQDKRRA